MNKLINIILTLVFILLSSITYVYACGTCACSNERLILKSTDFSKNTNISKTYTCDDKNISPELYWIGLPIHTETYALTLTDVDAKHGHLYHWVLYNIPKTMHKLPQNLVHLTEGMAQGKNSWNQSQYVGACPPLNSTHHYLFTLYALDKTLTFKSSPTTDEFMTEIKNHIIATGKLETQYSR